MRDFEPYSDISNYLLQPLGDVPKKEDRTSCLCVIQHSKFSSSLPPVEAHLSCEQVDDWHLSVLSWFCHLLIKKIILFMMREVTFSFVGRSVSSVSVQWAAGGKTYCDQFWNNHCIYAYCETSNKAWLKLTAGGCLYTLCVEGEDQSRKFCSVVVQNLHG